MMSVVEYLEEFTNHTRTLSNVLLNKLAPNDPNEAGISAIGDGTGQERLSRTRRSVAQHSLGWVDSELDKLLWMQHGELYDLRSATTCIKYTNFAGSKEHNCQWRHSKISQNELQKKTKNRVITLQSNPHSPIVRGHVCAPQQQKQIYQADVFC